MVVGIIILGFGGAVTLNVQVTPRMVIEFVVALVTAPRAITAPADRSTILVTTSRPAARAQVIVALSPTPTSRMMIGIIMRRFVGANTQVVPLTVIDTGDTA
jgi:hypothetical protein